MPYFAASDNVKLYYEEHGEGKPVVFIHGWSCNRHFFDKQYSAFEKKYKVLRFDHRGHGDSEVPEKNLTLARLAQDVKELIEFREYKDVTLLGWSMGAHVIWEYIQNYGCDNISKVVMLDMTPKMMADKGENWPHTIFDKYTREDGMNYLEAICKDWDSVAEGFVPAMFSDGPCQEDQKKVLAWAKRNTPHVMVHLWLAIIQKDYRDVLKRVTVPQLYTYGSRKSLYTKENAEYIRENTLDCKIAAFNGGHIHFMQDPDHFNRTVIDFIG